jgi:5-methyltetrahydrofolate--homocysteine methyltransferase
MADLLAAVRSGRTLLMDGAMGTELQRRGLRQGECGEIWNVTHPEHVRAVHQAYADAGAEVLLTNTFQAYRPVLSRHWGEGQHFVDDYIEAAKDIIAPFVSDGHYALCSGGPIVEPPDSTEFPDLLEFTRFALAARSVKPYTRPASPIGGLLLETCSTPRVRLAVGRARWGGGVPVLLSLTYLRAARGRITTLSGHSPEWFAERARGYGADALGVNCGRDIGMDEVIEIVRRYRAVTDLPLFARPNAGTPTRKGKRSAYPQAPEAMAARLPELLEAGVSMVGGCCGTTPEHIAAFRPVVDRWNRRH